MATIAIYRPGSPPTLQATVQIDEKTVFSKRLMNEHKITADFYSATILSIQIGDYITYNAENYYINRLPGIVKLNDSTFQYKIDFEGSIYNLSKKLFISSDGLADFAYTGDPTDFITNIVTNINLIDSTWYVGDINSADDQTIQFQNESCRAALVKIAEAFKMEFEIAGKVINLKTSIGTITAYTFEYGRDKGLCKLERQQVSDQNIVTKVYGFGGEKNIPYTYRSGAKRLTFSASGMAASGYLVSAASGLYGTIEGQFTDDAIYPKRTAAITDVNIDFNQNGTEFNPRSSYIEDSALDFNLNDYLIEGVTPQIVFKSGDLSGVECDIWKYDNANKRIYFNPSIDKNGYTLPFYNGGSPVLPAIGDFYTLVNISMPSSYIMTAETELQVATQAYLDENCLPQVIYSGDIDAKHAKSISLSLDIGDKVTIVDSALGINSLIRISGMEFPLTNPYAIKTTIADFVPYTLQERIIKKTVENKQDILLVDQLATELARINALRLKRKENAIPMYQGVYDAGKTYYGTLSRIDIVKYNIPDDDPDEGDIYFIARPDAPSESFSGVAPTDTDYWERFQAQFSSVATDLLFAALAFIDNLGVREFDGVPVSGGYFKGAVKISGNDIWENTVNDDTTGTIRINFNGYNGGTTRDRSLIIGCGKGREIIVINGVNSNGRTPGLVLTEGVLQVPVYATAATRNADIPYPVPGMIIYQQDEAQFMGYVFSSGWVRFTMH